MDEGCHFFGTFYQVQRVFARWGGPIDAISVKWRNTPIQWIKRQGYRGLRNPADKQHDVRRELPNPRIVKLAGFGNACFRCDIDPARIAQQIGDQWPLPLCIAFRGQDQNATYPVNLNTQLNTRQAVVNHTNPTFALWLRPAELSQHRDVCFNRFYAHMSLHVHNLYMGSLSRFQIAVISPILGQDIRSDRMLFEHSVQRSRLNNEN